MNGVMTKNERRAMARINRRAKSSGQIVRKTRDGTSTEKQLGRFYVVDTETAALIEKDVDIFEFGQRIKQSQISA